MQRLKAHKATNLLKQASVVLTKQSALGNGRVVLGCGPIPESVYELMKSPNIHTKLSSINTMLSQQPQQLLRQYHTNCSQFKPKEKVCSFSIPFLGFNSDGFDGYFTC